MMQYGWICPRCQTVNAPAVAACACKAPTVDSLPDTHTLPPNFAGMRPVVIPQPADNGGYFYQQPDYGSGAVRICRARDAACPKTDVSECDCNW